MILCGDTMVGKGGDEGARASSPPWADIGRWAERVERE